MSSLEDELVLAFYQRGIMTGNEVRRHFGLQDFVCSPPEPTAGVDREKLLRILAAIAGAALGGLLFGALL